MRTTTLDDDLFGTTDIVGKVRGIQHQISIRAELHHHRMPGPENRIFGSLKLVDDLCRAIGKGNCILDGIAGFGRMMRSSGGNAADHQPRKRRPVGSTDQRAGQAASQCPATCGGFTAGSDIDSPLGNHSAELDLVSLT